MPERIKNASRAAWLAVVLVLAACGGGGGGGGGGSDEAATDCSAGVTQIALETEVSNVSIAEQASHCYRFDAIPGGIYRITVTTLAGDADVAAFDDAVMDGNSVLAFSDAIGTFPDEIVINPDVSRVYIEVFGFLASTYNLLVVPQKPVAVVPPRHEVALDQRVFLDGGASSSVNGGSITHFWRLLSRPPASTAAFADQSGESVEFVPDAFGDYEFELYVHDTYLHSDPVTTTVSVNYHQTALNFETVDAEYSAALERAVLVSAGPNALHLFEPLTRTLESVPLPHLPNAVAVSPDGLFAAVGHDQWVSYVDLSGATLIKTLPVSVDVNDLVLDANGIAHLVGGSYYNSLDLATEIETPGSNATGPMSSIASIRLDPARQAIFTTDKIRVDVSSGVATGIYAAQQTVFTNFPFDCRKIWLSEDYERLFWRCGEVMKLYPTRQQDYARNGSLDNVGSRYRVVDLDHSREAGVVAAIIEDIFHTDPDTTWDSNLRFYDDESLVEVPAQPLPLVANSSASFPVHGKHVFASGDGTQYAVIAMVDAAAGLAGEYFVFTTPKQGDPTGANRTPVADAGGDRAANPLAAVTLDGGGSSDADGDALSFSWRVVEAPTGSIAALGNPAAETPTFTPDLTGRYVLGLTVSDGFLNSHEDLVVLTAASTADSFLLQPGFDIFDVEFNEATGLIVGISSQEQALIAIDSTTFAQQRVDLPEIGHAVSVSPDGLTAAVAHFDAVSIVDLATMNLTATHPVSLQVIGDVVLDGNGYAHLFEGFLSGFAEIRSIAVATGVETLSVGSPSPRIFNQTIARLHPNGDWIYGANNGVFPDDIEKYDVSGNPTNILYDSPYHGTYDMCGNLWFSESTDEVVTACGNLFTTDAIEAQDMLFVGTVPLGLSTEIIDMASSAEQNEFAVIARDRTPLNPDPTRDDSIRFYADSPPYALSHSQELTRFEAGGTTYPASGKFVFFNGDGSRFIAVTRAEDTAPILDEYGIQFSTN